MQKEEKHHVMVENKGMDVKGKVVQWLVVLGVLFFVWINLLLTFFLLNFLFCSLKNLLFVQFAQGND